jgi:pimeloyl-ACP methyl ester carboxylesterase
MITKQVLLDDGAFTTFTQWGEQGPIVLLVHGMTSSRIGWTRLAQVLCATHRVVAYDQRGHGDMGSVTGPMTIEQSLADLSSVADALGHDVAALIGHSWGGAIAIRGAARVGARRTIAIDPVIRQVSSVWYDEYLEELEATFALQGAEREARVRADYADVHPLDVAGKVHAMHAMEARALERLRDENPPEWWDLRPDVKAFASPLLLALADPSESIIAGEDFRYLEELRNPNVTVEVFEGEGHSLHRSAFERFAALVRMFLPNDVYG